MKKKTGSKSTTKLLLEIIDRQERRFTTTYNEGTAEDLTRLEETVALLLYKCNNNPDNFVDVYMHDTNHCYIRAGDITVIKYGILEETK